MDAKFAAVIVGLVILFLFVFAGIEQQSRDCESKGGTPVQTNEGTTCFNNVIK